MSAAIPLLQHEAQYQNCFYIPGFPVPHLVVIFFIIVISVLFWHHLDFDCVMTTHNYFVRWSPNIYYSLHSFCMRNVCQLTCMDFTHVKWTVSQELSWWLSLAKQKTIDSSMYQLQLYNSNSIIFATYPGFASKKNYYEQLQQFAVCCSVHVSLYLID